MRIIALKNQMLNKKTQIAQLLELIDQPQISQGTVQRTLGYYNKNYNKTLQSLKKQKQWIVKNGNKIRQQQIKKEIECNKVIIEGFDKQVELYYKGNVIVKIKAKNHYPNQSSKQDLYNLFIYTLQKATSIADNRHTRIVIIYDRKGFNRKKNFNLQMLQTFKKVLAVLQQYYPGVIKRVFVLYSDIFFNSLFKVVQLLISQKLKKTIFFVQNWASLSPYIDQSQLQIIKTL